MLSGYEVDGETFKLISETDHRLKELCEDVSLSEFNTPELDYVIEMMTKTMLHNVGVGLAAPQVGIKKQIIVTADPLLPVLINPKVITATGEQLAEEGCLSFPKLFAFIKRCKSVEVVYQIASGENKSVVFENYLAVIVQHEIDHLNGVVFTDHMSPMKLRLANKRRYR